MNISLDSLPIKLDKNVVQKTILISAAIIILLLDFFLFLRPQFRGLSELSTKHNKLSQEVKQARADIKRLKKFEERYEAVKENLGNIENMVPEEEELPLILEDLSRIANDANVKIIQMLPLRDSREKVFTSDTGIYYKIPVSIEASSGYHKFGEFLNNIENSDIFMRISEFEVAASKKSTTKHIVRLIVDIFVIEK